MTAVSQEEAKKPLDPQLGEFKSVMAGLPENFLPPSLEIVWADGMDSPDRIEALFGKIRQFPEVEEVFYGKSRMEKLEFLFKPVRSLWVGGTTPLAFIVVLTAFNSTKVTLTARRGEVEVFRILGATPLFAKIPFYMESIFLGIVSGIVAMGLLTVALTSLTRQLPLPIPASQPWDS